MPIRFRGIFILPLVFIFSKTILFAQFDPPKTVLNTAFPYLNLNLNDWDKDGDPDFLFFKFQTNQLDWMENIGGGRLAQPAMLTDKLANQAMPQKIADFDGDGEQDFLEVQNVGGQNAIMLNRNLGNGDFSPKVIWQDTALQSVYFEVLPSDLDGDGDLDIAFIMRNPAVIWNLGNGQFSGQTILGGALNSNFTWTLLRALDLENDGDLDLIAQRDNGSAPELFSIPNLGNGTFGTKQSVTLLGSLQVLITEDFDADGRTDIGFAAHGTGAFYWLQNLGNGSFATEQALWWDSNFSSQVSQILFTDWDGDGLKDLFCLRAGTFTDSYLFRQKSPGVFVPYKATSNFATSYDIAALADLNADGKSELYGLYPLNVLGRFDNLGGVAPFLTKFHWFYPAVRRVQDVNTGDLDEDGLPDLVLSSDFDHELPWLKNLGNQEFAPPKFVTADAGNSTNTQIADFNGDGHLDVAALPLQWSLGSPKIHLNDGTGKFSVNPIWVPSTGDPQIFQHFRVGDLDGDGDVDIMGEALLSGGSDNLIWFKNDSTGRMDTYEIAVANITTWIQGGTRFELADLDGDADLDIEFISKTDGISVALNDGTGKFAAPFSPTPPAGALLNELPLVGDLDGDGDLDLTNIQLAYWSENLGGGTFSAFKPTTATKPFILSSSLADLDGDGDADFLANFNDGSYGWCENLGNATFADPIILGFDTQTTFDLIGRDLDGDGSPEIIVFSEGSIQIFPRNSSLVPINGRCFWDKNENGKLDAGEPPLPGISLKISPDDALTLPNGKGEFRFWLKPGTHELSFLVHDCWELTSDSATFHLDLPGAAGKWFEFGFRQKSQAMKLKASLASDPTVCGRKVQFWGIVQNTGCSPIAGSFHLFPDARMTFASASVNPFINTASELAWTFDTLWPGQTATIPVVFDLSNGMSGDILKISSIAETSAGGAVFADTVHYSPIILCSYDPNDKAVDRTQIKEGYLPETGELIYTVRFQNTGNFKAFDVRVHDLLDPQLDWETFRPIAASHNFYPVLNLKTGALDFVFPDINLPDSTSNERESHGFVQFAIRLNSGLPKGSVVPNSVAIYFDQNPAVLTNSALTEIVGLSVAGEPVLAKNYLKLRPNPAKTQIEAEWKTPLPSSGAELELINPSGQTVLHQFLAGGETRVRLEVADLPAGVYFLKIGGLAGVVVLLGN